MTPVMFVVRQHVLQIMFPVHLISDGGRLLAGSVLITISVGAFAVWQEWYCRSASVTRFLYPWKRRIGRSRVRGGDCFLPDRRDIEF